MKFEKFLKSVGTHGYVCARDNGDKWLVCGGVGMKIPTGVDNLLGHIGTPEKVKNFVESIVYADTDDRVYLTRAKIEKDGKASDIIRVFGDGLNIEVGIVNAAFGLLEKSDVNLAEVEIEEENTKYLLILDSADEVIGFIQGVTEL